MNHLITILIEKAGITSDQATKAIDVFKEYVKDKFPMMAATFEDSSAGVSMATSNVVAGAENPATSNSIMDKISDVIPGETGEKVENFVKDTADKVGDAFDSLKDKVSGLFQGKKDKEA